MLRLQINALQGSRKLRQSDFGNQNFGDFSLEEAAARASAAPAAASMTTPVTAPASTFEAAPSILESMAEESPEPKKAEPVAAIFGRPPQLFYSFQGEDLMFALASAIPPLDYDKLWYGEQQQKPPLYQPEEDHWAEIESSESESLSQEEVGQVVIKIQYSAALGTLQGISLAERRRFSNWEKQDCNKALLMYYHRMYAVTDDVDYSKV